MTSEPHELYEQTQTRTDTNTNTKRLDHHAGSRGSWEQTRNDTVEFTPGGFRKRCFAVW